MGMITVTILTKNCAKTLKKTLDSLATFSEVLILDSGSSDQTLEIAQTVPNVTIHKKSFSGFGQMHNLASSLAKHDWILSIDSDEVLSPELIEEIHQLHLDENCVYSLSRENYLNGKQIKWGGGWYPDRVIRLYHRKKTAFSTDLVHEKVLKKELKEITLTSPLLHTPYLEIQDFLAKMQHYTFLFAEQKKSQNATFSKALFHSWFAFFKSYILKKGFLGGKEGYLISKYNADTTFYKYLRVAERSKKRLL